MPHEGTLRCPKVHLEPEPGCRYTGSDDAEVPSVPCRAARGNPRRCRRSSVDDDRRLDDHDHAAGRLRPGRQLLRGPRLPPRRPRPCGTRCARRRGSRATRRRPRAPTGEHQGHSGSGAKQLRRRKHAPRRQAAPVRGARRTEDAGGDPLEQRPGNHPGEHRPAACRAGGRAGRELATGTGRPHLPLNAGAALPHPSRICRLSRGSPPTRARPSPPESRVRRAA